MNVHVNEVGQRARIAIIEEPDGVNPPQVFELIVRDLGSGRFEIRLSSGSTIEFAELESDEPDEDRFPVVIFDGVVEP